MKDATTRSLIPRRAVLKGRMGFLSARQWMTTALLALVVAVFVLVPSVEAATCQFEEQAAQTMVLDTPADKEADTRSGEGLALCSYGHCHHAGMTLLSPTTVTGPDFRVGEVLLPPMAAPLAFGSPSGLERPPRA